MNFVNAEKALLLDLVDAFGGTIENMRTDATTSKVRLTVLHEVSRSSTSITVI